MAIVGFNFEKLTVERKGPISSKLNISSNIDIKKVEKEDLFLGKEKKKGVKFTFEFTINYEPKVGNILATGHVLFYEDSKQVDEIVEGWKKNKRLPTPLSTQVLNLILTRCNLKSLTLAQEVNLPPHLQMPRVKAKESSKDYIG